MKTTKYFLLDRQGKINAVCMHKPLTSYNQQPNHTTPNNATTPNNTKKTNHNPKQN